MGYSYVTNKSQSEKGSLKSEISDQQRELIITLIQDRINAETRLNARIDSIVKQMEANKPVKVK